MNKITTSGKCILVGEHAVVRGKSAVVFPLTSKSLNLAWNFSKENDEIEVKGEGLAPAFLKVISSLKEKGLFLPEGTWQFELSSDIPTRAGLGSSAALTVAVARLFSQYDAIPKNEIFSQAMQMENIFHGTSSGIDVASVLEAKPIRFVKGETPKVLDISWEPKLYLYDTGLRSSTKDCVQKVAAMNRADLDHKMETASQEAQEALEKVSLPALAKAMEIAKECFMEWGLIPTEVQTQMNTLRHQGALAVKPTGSGNGGFLLSLWEKDPPKDLGLIKI